MNGRPGGGPAAPPPRAAAAPPTAGGGAKRQRTEPLAGVTIFVPKQGLPHSTQIFKVWSKSVPSLGGAVTQDEGCPAITHVLIPRPAPPAAKSGGLGGSISSSSFPSSSPTVACHRSGWDSVPACLHPGKATAPTGVAYVTPQWLTDCLRLQRRQPEIDYRAPTAEEEEAAAAASAAAAAGGGGASGAGEWGSDDEGEPAVKDLEAWLGPLWRPECAAMGRVELTLQGDYDVERCRRIGNEPLVQALRELHKCEVALNGQFLTNAQGKQVGNHKALTYAQAAAAVRTCAYKLRSPVLPGQVPWVAGHTASEVTEVLERGTCEKLEGFRRNEVVRDSKRALRPDSAGAAARRLFTKLPGVGAKAARTWWDLGLRTFEEVEAAGAAGQAGGKPFKLTLMQQFSLEHWADLLEGTSSGDVTEMAAALEAALERVSRTRGWQIELVGGSRRKRPVDVAQQDTAGVAGAARAAGAPAEHAEHGQHGQQHGRGGSMEDGRAGLGAAGAAACSRGGDGGFSSSNLIAGITAGQHHDADFMISHPTYAWD